MQHTLIKTHSKYIISDITKLINSEIQLKLSQEKLERAQEISKSGNWEEDHLSGKIIWQSLKPGSKIIEQKICKVRLSI